MATAADVAAIPDLHFWVRGDGVTPATVGSGVTSWADRGPNGFNATNPTTASRPTYVSSPKPGVDFSGAQQVQLLSGASASLTAETVFAVIQPDLTDVHRTIRGASEVGASGGTQFRISDGKLNWTKQGIASVVSSGASIATNALTAVSGSYSATAATLFINGTAAGNVANPPAPTSGRTTRLGSGYDGNENFDGRIHEFIQFARVLTASERATVHSYLQDSGYGITVSDYVAPSGDTTAPTISSFTATPGDSQVALVWAGTDNVGITRWVATRGSTTIYDGTATSFTDTGRTNGTALSYGLTAYDAAGNTKTASASATPAATQTTLKTRVGGSWVDRVNRVRSGGAWVSVLFRVLASAGQVIDPGTGVISTPARWQVPFGSAPLNRATWETGVNTAGQAQVAWVGSMPDTRARSSRLETGVLSQAQDGYQAQIIDTTNSVVVADSGAVTGTAEKWVAASFTPVAGRVYRGQARVRAADGQWSAYAATRFVAPTGTVRFFETFGAVGDGTTNDNSAIRTAIDSCNPGDVLRSNSPGTVLTGVSASSTTLTAATALFTSGMVGKTVLIRGAGTSDATSNSWFHRTTISAVASDGKSATIAAAVLTAITSTTVIVGARIFLAGHTDVDGGLNNGGTNARRGGQTIDGTGCVFVSDNVNSAGFRTTLPDVTYRNVHFWQRTATTRGNGLNGNTGPFFIEGAAAIGLRLIGCVAERARDAGFLIYNASSDIHVVDCIADHTNADGFHVTGSGHDIQFIRTRNYYIGDDAVANIGYRSDGDSARPYNIVWENPEVYGQDWGRGVSFGGCYNCLVTDLRIERGAGASFILGSDQDMANTANIQIRRFTIVAPNLRRGQKPTYSQGSGTSSTIPDEPVIKWLNSNNATPQRDFLLEDGVMNDARYMQIIQYGGSTFVDNTITMRGLSFIGTTNAGTNWVDQGTYPQHFDLRGITVPSGSTAITAAPANANS